MDLGERHDASSISHNVGGVGPAREGHEERGVFAAGREREGPEPLKGSSQRCGIGTSGPVVVLGDDLAAAIEAELSIAQRALDTSIAPSRGSSARGPSKRRALATWRCVRSAPISLRTGASNGAIRLANHAAAGRVLVAKLERSLANRHVGKRGLYPLFEW